MPHSQDKKPLTRSERIRILISSIAAFLMLAGAAAIWYFRDTLFVPGESVLSVSGTDSRLVFNYEPGSEQCFATVGKALAVATGSGFRLLGADGSTVVSSITALDAPAIDACSGYAAVFDQGGQGLFFADTDGTVTSPALSGDLLALHCSESGHCALITREAGYRAVVTVLNADHSEIWNWHCSTAYVLSARVSPDGRSVAVLCLNDSGSEVKLFSLSSEKQQAAFSVSDTVAADLHWFTADKLCVFGAERVQFFTAAGTWSATYDFAGRHPIFYRAAGSFLAFALSPYRSGAASTVVTLDASGKELADIAVTQEILSLDASNGELLILDAAGASMYSSAGDLRGRLTDTAGFKTALIRNKGEALLLASGFAEVYKF